MAAFFMRFPPLDAVSDFLSARHRWWHGTPSLTERTDRDLCGETVPIACVEWLRTRRRSAGPLASLPKL